MADRVISVRLDDRRVERLDEAVRDGESRSDVVRQLIDTMSGVWGVMEPSGFTPQRSEVDALRLAAKLRDAHVVFVRIGERTDNALVRTVDAEHA